MDTILNYLENMFLNLPKTEDVERAKRELANMMEDKYNELLTEGRTDNEAVGIVISEFGNLKELAAELGLGDMQEGQFIDASVPRRVSDEEAKAYIEETKKSANGVAIGVMLCICSPSVLLILGAMKERYEAVTDAVMGAVGVSVLLIQIAIGVGILIYYGIRLEKYDYLKKEEFSISKTALIYVKNYEATYQNSFVIKLIFGVVLCIVSVIPVLVIGSIWDDSYFVLFSVVFLLLMISVAVWFFITGGTEKEALKVLQQKDEFSVKSKKGNKLSEKIAGIYWPIITCVYLAWSFVTMSWGVTWIIWPIAGVLFGAVAAICSVLEKDQQ